MLKTCIGFEQQPALLFDQYLTLRKLKIEIRLLDNSAGTALAFPTSRIRRLGVHSLARSLLD